MQSRKDKAEEDLINAKTRFSNYAKSEESIALGKYERARNDYIFAKNEVEGAKRKAKGALREYEVAKNEHSAPEFATKEAQAQKYIILKHNFLHWGFELAKEQAEEAIIKYNAAVDRFDKVKKALLEKFGSKEKLKEAEDKREKEKQKVTDAEFEVERLNNLLTVTKSLDNKTYVHTGSFERIPYYHDHSVMYPDTNIDAEANDYVDYLPTMPDNCNNDTAMTNELIIGITFLILMIGTVLYGIYEKNFKVKNDAVTKTNLKKSQSNKESKLH